MTILVKSILDQRKTGLTVSPESWLKAEFLTKRQKPYVSKTQYMDYILDKQIQDNDLVSEWQEFRKKFVKEQRARDGE